MTVLLFGLGLGVCFVGIVLGNIWLFILGACMICAAPLFENR